MNIGNCKVIKISFNGFRILLRDFEKQELRPFIQVFSDKENCLRENNQCINFGFINAFVNVTA